MFIELIKSFILGIVQGITEWLPVSSTGHMLLVDEFLQLDFPKEFTDYIAFLEEKLQVPITIVSVGPDRTQTIELKK